MLCQIMGLVAHVLRPCLLVSYNPLHSIRDGIQKTLITRFKNMKIAIRTPAVVVHFGTDASESTEIIPAKFIKRDADSNHIYEIADGDGGWMRSSPDAHKNYVDEVDRKFDGKVKQLVRLLKAWKYYCGVPMSSFYLEICVTKYASQKPSIVYARDVNNILTLFWNDQLAALHDPKNISGDILPCSSEKQKADALAKLKIALGRAQTARAAERRGKIGDAFSGWNDVYNKKFPV